MMGKHFFVALLLGISFSCAYGKYLRYFRRPMRSDNSWDITDSWPNSQSSLDEYTQERRSAPNGFSAVRGKRDHNPENAALVSALMKLVKLRSREALRPTYPSETDEDQMNQYLRYELDDESSGQAAQYSGNYPDFDVKRSSGKNYIPTERREVPQGFFIARGKKRSDLDDESFRFYSARGKKSYDSTRGHFKSTRSYGYDPRSYESLNRRAVPDGFYLSRGKRDYEVANYGAGDQNLHVMKPHLQ